MPLGYSGWWPAILQNTLQCTGYPTTKADPSPSGAKAVRPPKAWCSDHFAWVVNGFSIIVFISI